MCRKHSKPERRSKSGDHDSAKAFQANAENGRSRKRKEKRRVKGRITREDIIGGKNSR